MTRAVLLSLALLIGSLGCSDAGGPAAEGAEGDIAAAVRAYLAARTDLNLSSLKVEVVNIQQAGDTASATAEFRAPGGVDPLLSMPYQLQRVGGEWQVQGGSQAGAAPHASPQQEQMPPGHPPTGGAGGWPQGGGGGGELPPNHPPVGGSGSGGGGSELPPGHPPVVQ